MSGSSIEIRFSFGITIRVSTSLLKLLIPSKALFIRFLPSNPNGVVTTPTVKAPAFLAHPATIGAEPVPVPPPIPAVTKTTSAPETTSEISLMLSFAESLPILGSAPAPRPRVLSLPISILTSAKLGINA